MNERADLAESVRPGLRQALAEAGFGRGRWRAVGKGWEAACFRHDGDGGPGVILKVARKGDLGPTIPITGEADALRAFGAALEPGGAVHTPAVLRVFSEFDAYLMEAAPGHALHAWVLRPLLPRGWDALLAARLVDGLAVYYGALEAPFGDFQPGNLLIAGGVEPWFLDPVARDPTLLKLDRAGAFAPGAVDIGLFVFKAVSRVPRPAAATPWAWWRLLRLTRKLVREAAERFAPADQAGFEAAARDVALAHLEDLAAHPWPRDRVAAVAGRRLLRIVLPRA